MAIPRTFFGPINKLVVGDWFDMRASEAMKEFAEDSASGCTELKYLKRERKLVEASLSFRGGAKSGPEIASMEQFLHPRSVVNVPSLLSGPSESA